MRVAPSLDMLVRRAREALAVPLAGVNHRVTPNSDRADAGVTITVYDPASLPVLERLTSVYTLLESAFPELDVDDYFTVLVEDVVSAPAVARAETGSAGRPQTAFVGLAAPVAATADYTVAHMYYVMAHGDTYEHLAPASRSNWQYIAKLATELNWSPSADVVGRSQLIEVKVGALANSYYKRVRAWKQQTEILRDVGRGTELAFALDIAPERASVQFAKFSRRGPHSAMTAASLPSDLIEFAANTNYALAS